ncbi:uncharacterized protein LOC144162848 isoform X3 [Haemaphysalis longicornis]
MYFATKLFSTALSALLIFIYFSPTVCVCCAVCTLVLRLEVPCPAAATSSCKGRLEGLELGVPAAGFGQRFCAWGAPCADARLSIVGVRLGLRYAKALHSRLDAWSPHQQPPGMLQRRLPAGPLSAFSTLSRRRIGVAFSALALFDKSGHLFEVPNPKRVQACPCSVQACNPSRRQNMTS